MSPAILCGLCFYFDSPLPIMCVYSDKVYVVAHNELQINTAFILATGPWLLKSHVDCSPSCVTANDSILFYSFSLWNGLHNWICVCICRCMSAS